MSRSAIEKLFDRLNRKYWAGRLPRYRVFESQKHGGLGMCLRGKKRIYIRAGFPPYIRRKVLLHEMCHAATNDAHGKVWQAEMLRIADLGAPTKREAMHYGDPNHIITAPDIVGEFGNAGFELPNAKWSDMRDELYRYGCVDNHGRAFSRSAARFIRKLRDAFHEGQRTRREMDATKERFRRKRGDQANLKLRLGNKPDLERHE
jgi:hypothetical protein